MIRVEELAPPNSGRKGSGSTISLRFSEAMEFATAIDPANFSVAKDGGGSISVIAAVLSPDGKTIELTTAAPFDINSSYTVTMDNLTDIPGRPLGVADPHLDVLLQECENRIDARATAGEHHHILRRDV